MSGSVTVRPFCGGDTFAVLDCWREALAFDAVGLEALESRVLLDQNFESDGFQCAWVDGELAGFVVCYVLNKPIEKTGFREDTGFISAMGVSPRFRRRGVGSALMDQAEDFFRERGRSIIVIAPYTPNYFVPGVDKDRYPEGIRFLESKGFTEYSEALAADALISTFEISERTLEKEKSLAAEGILVRHYVREDLAAFMQFLRDYMPGPWIEDARRNLLDLAAGRFTEDSIWLAFDTTARSTAQPGGRIIGFCQNEREHFGPFGVCDEYQGKGIGTVLLARTLYAMRVRGYHSAWVLWTGQRALDGVYGRLGFKQTRRFAIMKKEITAS
jgi:GNAT superfamily N-acetyltransferase